MNKDKELEKMKEDYQNIALPKNGVEGMKEAIERAKKDKARKKKLLVYKRIGATAAAVLLVAILLPNVNVNIAMAMEKIPVIGSFVRVVTFGRYDFEDENHEAKVEIPKVELEDTTQETEGKPVKDTVDTLNKDIEEYINPIVKEFEDSLSEEEKKALDITYDVVTDNDKWFTLRLNVLEIQASGYQYAKYYHINKLTGERATLKDIFLPGTDYVGILSNEIMAQMRQQMETEEGKIYFLDNEDMPDDNFKQIKEDENFYFNENGEVVIAFDEYEVAPGYMGSPQFTIPASVTEGIMRK